MTMTPERWGHIKAVFREAMETPPGERSAFVERACGQDVVMRADLESLLAATAKESVPPIAPKTIVRALADVGGDPLDSDVGMRSVLESALGKEYEIAGRLGRGGMGAVYLARDILLHRDVAIKVLRPDLAAFAPAARARFKREAQICASLEHPGIVPLYRYGEAGAIRYFVMGYVRGETLADRLRLEGPVPSEEARRILLELTDALEHAHCKHVIHRDIKSANILLENGDVRRPKLADFGISKVQGAADTLTPSATVIGTPAYMSPEQLHGLTDIDERSDIYSLGLVGYAMLVGREPFAGVDDVSTWRLAHEPEPLSTAAPLVPLGLAAVIMRCLERDRALRWPDARSLKEALARADRESPQLLPEAVRDLPGYGQYALVWSIVWTALALVPKHSPRNVVLLLLLAGLVPLGLALHIWNVGRAGLSYRDLAQVACWPPEWWGMWWPSMLRRPRDLWPRLPWPARVARGMLSLFFVVLPTLILLETTKTFDPAWLDTVKYSLLAGTAAVTIGGLGWARHKDLPVADAMRVLFGATMPSPAWKAPQVARLLTPARGVRQPNFAHPADCVRAIDDLVSLIPPDAASLGAEVTIRAHRLLIAISECDHDIAWLDRHSSATELARLEIEMAELDEERSVRGNDNRRDFRELVRRQLAAAQGMRADLELASGQRAGLLDLMRAVWRQLCRLHEPTATCGTPDGPDPREALRGLCAEIDEALDAPGNHQSARLAIGS